VFIAIAEARIVACGTNAVWESWPEMRRKPGTDTNFRRSLPEFGCLLGWAFRPRNFMKNWHHGDGGR
jgi:hypothetical protein